MNIKPKHLEFAMNYLRTKDPAVAYKMTYPRAGIKSLNAAASRLLARPDVAEFIEDTEQRIRERALEELTQSEADDLHCQLLTIKQKRDVLAKIITGQTKRRRHIQDKYGSRLVEDDLPVYAIIRAIDMDTRLEMFHNFLLGSNLPANHKQQKNFYVNAPTLQQQVNILISQTQQQEKETQEPQNTVLAAPETPTNNTVIAAPEPQTHETITQNTSPLKRDRGKYHKTHEIPPSKEVPDSRRAEDVHTPRSHPTGHAELDSASGKTQTRNTSPLKGDRGKPTQRKTASSLAMTNEENNHTISLPSLRGGTTKQSHETPTLAVTKENKSPLLRRGRERPSPRFVNKT